MKQRVKHSMAFVLAMLLLVSSMLPAAMAAPKTSGSCGKNLKWSFSAGTLTISGKGTMYFPEEDIPWDELEIKKVVVKEGVTSLADYAFGWCEELSSVSLPKSLKSIGLYVFNGTKLKGVKVAKGSKYFSTKDGVLFNKKKTVLYYYPTKKKGSSYTVPSSVKTIAEGAFAGSEGLAGYNPYLHKLVLPKKLKKVEQRAFAWSGITQYKFQAGNPTIEDWAFDGASATILYPKNHKKCWTAALKAIMKRYSEEEKPDLKLKAY